MKFNFDDVYEIESGASHKKIYRFNNHNEGKIIVDFSYNYNDYLSFLEINNFLLDFFKKKTPNFGWLSEESLDDRSRLQSEFFWCLDPIDGTRSYILGKPEYTISLALINNSKPIFGIVYNPVTNEYFYAEENNGAFCNETLIKVNSKKSIETTLLKNNENEILQFIDLRTTDHFPKISNYIDKNLPYLHKIPIIRKFIRYFFYSHNFMVKIKHYFKLNKYFK